MRRLATLKPTVYLSLHIDHPDELTPPVVELIGELRRYGFILISQSVFLKGVNDDVATLERLFTELFQLGVRPYYIYHCQRIPTTDRFEMEFADEVEIMSTLRERLSGLAFHSMFSTCPRPGVRSWCHRATGTATSVMSATLTALSWTQGTGQLLSWTERI